MPGAVCLAFSKGGHQVVAIAAFQRLQPATQQRVVSLLKAHPRYQQDFATNIPSGIALGQQGKWHLMQASIWPDLAKDFPGQEKTRYSRPKWHYINVPLFLTPADETALAKKVKVNLNHFWSSGLQEGGLNAVQALDRIQKLFRKSSTTDAERALMICWAAHLIGDLHQPLHSAALFSRQRFPEGDAGGNSIEVKTARLGGSVTKLHSFWDGLLGRDISFNDVQSRTTAALGEPAIVAEATKGLALQSPWAWVEEGASYAAEYAYADEIRDALVAQGSSERPVLLSSNYKSVAGEVARTRAIVGGYRLAQFLENLLK